VVFASGVIDEPSPRVGSVPQYGQLAGVEPGAGVGGWMFGTLLGPEESGAVPGGVIPPARLGCRPRLGVGGGGLVARVPPFPGLPWLWWGGGWWVGCLRSG
jgi:hypothetical protein